MKVNTKFSLDKSGISSVVGVAMAILILTTYFGGVYLWTASVQREMREFDWEREQEEFEVYATFNSELTISVSVENTGPIDVKLARLWLITEEKHDYVEFSQVVKTGIEDVDQTVVDGLTEGIDLTQRSSFVYQFKILTERGNIATAPLVSKQASLAEINYPLVIIEDDVTVDFINLTVWNSLHEEIRIDYAVVTKIDPVEPASLSVPKSMDCPSGQITSYEYNYDLTQFDNNKIRVELISGGLVVCASYYSL